MIAKRHTNDGVKRHDYVQSKIAHMKRNDLIGAHKRKGYGVNGGACPDSLNDNHDARLDYEAKQKRRMAS